MPRSDTNIQPITLTVAEGVIEEFPLDFGDGVIRYVEVSQARCPRGGNDRRVTLRPRPGTAVVVGIKRDQGRA